MQNDLRGTVGVFITEKDFLSVQDRLGLYEDMSYDTYLETKQEEFNLQGEQLGTCDFVRVEEASLLEFINDHLIALENIGEEVVDMYADVAAAAENLHGTDIPLDQWIRIEHLLDKVPGGIKQEAAERSDALIGTLLAPANLGQGFRSIVVLHDEDGGVDLFTARTVGDSAVGFERGSLELLRASLIVASHTGARVYASCYAVNEGQTKQMTFRFGNGEWVSLHGEILEMLGKVPSVRSALLEVPNGHHHLTMYSKELPEDCVIMDYDSDEESVTADPADVGLIDLLIASGMPTTIVRNDFAADPMTGVVDESSETVQAWSVDLMEVTPLSAPEAFDRLATIPATEHLVGLHSAASIQAAEPFKGDDEGDED